MAIPAIVVAALLATTGPAYAAVERCMTESESDGAQIVPGTGGGQKTREIQRQQARNTWDDHIWVGPPKICPRNAAEAGCKLGHTESKTTTTTWSVGLSIDLGNASSPSKKAANAVGTIMGVYQRSVEVTSSWTWEVNVKPGDTVEPVQIARRRWIQGDFVGGWVRTNRGCQGGRIYEWNGATRWGSWATNKLEKEIEAFKINGRVLRLDRPALRPPGGAGRSAVRRACGPCRSWPSPSA
jgi:hypothetical protein